MASFAIEIADSDVIRVITAVCANYKRPTQITNPDFIGSMPPSDENPHYINNPESEAQFANRMVRQFLSEHVIAHEIKTAKAAAAAAANPVVSIIDPSL
jgi:hypothetical protein